MSATLIWSGLRLEIPEGWICEIEDGRLGCFASHVIDRVRSAAPCATFHLRIDEPLAPEHLGQAAAALMKRYAPHGCQFDVTELLGERCLSSVWSDGLSFTTSWFVVERGRLIEVQVSGGYPDENPWLEGVARAICATLAKADPVMPELKRRPLGL